MPTIKKGSDNFQVVLDTGANIKTTAEAVFPSNSLIWIKDRANANNHQLIDTVRGSSAVLQSNTTAAETTYTAPTGNSVAWVWKAGGTAVTNTAGSITSQVSANPTAGFSVVTYTGDGSASATVGHGLGVAPAMVITKGLSGAIAWMVKHKSLSSNNNLLLNGTDAQTNAVTGFSNGGIADLTSATTFGFLSGTAANCNNSNKNGTNFVAYCFSEIAGYSKFGSYTGNGSTDGPFVYCGFRPKYVMIKATNDISHWTIEDGSRNPYNVATASLYADTSAAELTSIMSLDLLSNGFKCRNVLANESNVNGYTYIYAAFAENPFKYSLAR